MDSDEPIQVEPLGKKKELSRPSSRWVEVGTHTDETTFFGNVVTHVDETSTFYVDSATIRKHGDKVKMWTLGDFKTAQTFTDYAGSKFYSSLRSQDEYDCKEGQMRTLSLFRHSRNMGTGDIVFLNTDPSKWWPVPPESMSEVLWKFACGKP